MQSTRKKRLVICAVICALLSALPENALADAVTSLTADYKVNSITVKSGSTMPDDIPVGAFSAEVSITSKTSADSVYIVLAAYNDEGKLLSAESMNKTIGAKATVLCKFSFANSDGDICKHSI